MLVEKRLCMVILACFCSCVFIVGTPVNSPSVQFMHGIPQHSLMQTKATISIENREKLEGVKSVMLEAKKTMELS